MRGLSSAIRYQPVYGVDSTLFIATLCLVLTGLVMVASASVAIAQSSTGAPFYFFHHQLAYAVLGVLGGVLVFQVPLHRWEQLRFVLLGLALLLLTLVLVPFMGNGVNGARRWLELGPVTVQASEPARLLLLMYLAGYVVRRRRDLGHLGGMIKPMLPLGLAGFLMLLEPNFGGMVILMAVSMVMLFLAGARLRYFLLLTLLGCGVLGLLTITSPYRVERLASFTHPWENPFGSGYQLVQSLIAFGRGNVFGVGLGNSVQKLLYLPETQTDFLFSIVGEELGLVGCSAVIALFSLVVWRGYAIGRKAHDSGRFFGAYLAWGVSTWVGLQAFVNMGVCMGVLPTKGTTLPFMSYGGSSLVVMIAVVALLLRVDHETRIAQTPRRERKKGSQAGEGS